MSTNRTLDREFFFEQVTARLHNDHPLIAPTAAGYEAVLDYWEKHASTADDRHLAYILATAYHESARTMQPIREFGEGHGRPYGVRDPETGHVYYGRGLVQLTWRHNYARMSAEVGVNLVADPDRALDPDVSVAILVNGMKRGLFTGKSLFDYFDAERAQWFEARRIVNGLDQAERIATIGKVFYGALSYRGGY